MSFTQKHNPFRPNRPIIPELFSGRIGEIQRIDDILDQTRHGNPTDILILGERGIGKSSLLLLINRLANGNITWTPSVMSIL